MSSKRKRNRLVLAGILCVGLISIAGFKYMNMEKKYKWGGGASSPEGYPVEVTMGGFSYSALSFGVIIGPWGDVSYLGGDGWAPLPRQLVAEWVSFGEGDHGKSYQIKADLDYKKMEKLFDKEFELPQYSGKPAVLDHYSTVVAGFAPGGVVIVWVKGGGRMVEIGRYQGYEVTPEDSNLYPETLTLLTPFWHDTYMNNTQIVPADVREANKGKKVPYGLWDSLRERFNYTVKVACAEGGTFIGGTMRFVNGEFKYTFPEKEGEVLHLQEEAAPRNIVVVWRTSTGEKLVTEVYLEELYSLALFKQFQAGDKSTEIELTIRINQINDYYAVFIKNGKGREQIVKLNPKEEVKVYLAPKR